MRKQGILKHPEAIAVDHVENQHPETFWMFLITSANLKGLHVKFLKKAAATAQIPDLGCAPAQMLSKATERQIKLPTKSQWHQGSYDKPSSSFLPLSRWYIKAIELFVFPNEHRGWFTAQELAKTRNGSWKTTLQTNIRKLLKKCRRPGRISMGFSRCFMQWKSGEWL